MSWDNLGFYFSNLSSDEVCWWYLILGFLACFVFIAVEDDSDKTDSPLLFAIFLIWPVFIAFVGTDALLDKNSKFRKIELILFILVTIASPVAYFTYSELTMSPEQKIARAEKIYQKNKIAIEKDHEYKLREARSQVKLAEIEAKQRALYSGNSATNIKHDKQLAKAQAELSSLQAKGADYSKLSQATISSSKSEPVDEQTKLVLSALWLGACFFLQRLFEKLFEDKGYALLTVCAAGFLLAFFTANYFLLGGSVTGGIMGSVGDRA